ncbi:PilZ domain-containing protein [Oceanospirillum sanctuarii]|uniref:PilZ domain-containing protein n=1 Tax=Oceanospirillum sanctuarii TaxID=1434821 RepID=UPI001593EDB9|nr:PilZ domain-containing protein [Oceanospirillum sanctuarii]
MEFFLPSGEKRAFPRTRLSLSCELQLTEQEDRLLGQCLDLSTTGARVVLSEAIPSGTKAHFKLREHLGKEPFEAIVEITRVAEMPVEVAEGDLDSMEEPTRYCAGLKIIEII